MFSICSSESLICKATETYSQNSIMNAIQRFVTCVNKMNDTVLIPSRLKDINLEPEQLLGQKDTFHLFNNLNEIKNELCWGLNTGASTAATINLNQRIQIKNQDHLTYNQFPNQKIILPSHRRLLKCQSSASLYKSSNSTTSQTSKLLISPTCASFSQKDRCNYIGLDEGFCSTGSSLKLIQKSSSSLSLSDAGEYSVPHIDDDNSSELEEDNDTSSNSPQASSSSTSNSTTANDKLDTSKTNDSFHLFASFKLHLRGLHTILHQLADSSEFLTKKYQNDLLTNSN